MSIIVNGTTIPTVAGNIKVNGTNITKVIVNGTNVWEVPTLQYLIQNGTAIDGFSSYLHKNSPNWDLSTNYTFTVTNNGTTVVTCNYDTDKEFCAHIQSISTYNFDGRTLSFRGTVVNTNNEPGHLWLGLFAKDTSGNYVAHGHSWHVMKDWTNETNVPYTISGSIVLPSSGNGFIGFSIYHSGENAGEFKTTITELKIS